MEGAHSTRAREARRGLNPEEESMSPLNVIASPKTFTVIFYGSKSFAAKLRNLAERHVNQFA
jgi:hypothetical protein